MDTILQQEMQSFVNRNRCENEIKDKDHFKWLDTIHEPSKQVNVSDIIRFEPPQKEVCREKPILLPGEEIGSATIKNNVSVHHTKNGDKIYHAKTYRTNRYGTQRMPKTLLKLNKERNIQTIEW